MSLPTRKLDLEVPAQIRSEIEQAARAQMEQGHQVEENARPTAEVVDPRVDQGQEAHHLTEADRAAAEHEPLGQLDPAARQAYIDELVNSLVPRLADNMAARRDGWVVKLVKFTVSFVVGHCATQYVSEFCPIVKERAIEYGNEAAQWVVEQGALVIEHFCNKESEAAVSDMIYNNLQQSPVMMKLNDSTVTKETFRILEKPEMIEAFVAEHDVDGSRFWKDHRPDTTLQPGEIPLSKTFLGRQKKALNATLPTQINTWVKIKEYEPEATTLSNENFLARRDTLISEYYKEGPDAMYDAAGKTDNQTHQPALETLSATVDALLKIVN